MKRPEIFSDIDRAIGSLHMLVRKFKELPLEEQCCDRFDGEPETLISQKFLRATLLDFELNDDQIYSYALYLQTNLTQTHLEIVTRLQSGLIS